MSDEDVDPLCDLVLAGGVTSALVYTGLIARLSLHYRFKRFGGTSSGAVAAAAGAIAQRAKLELLKQPAARRTKSPGAAFEALRDFPDQLADVDTAGRTALFCLFQPQTETRSGYQVVSAWLQRRAARPSTTLAPLMHALAACVRNFPLAAVLGAVPGVWLLILAARDWPGSVVPGSDVLDWTFVIAPAASLGGVLLGLLLAVALGVVSAATAGTVRTLAGMRRNGFGLCNGVAGCIAPAADPNGRAAPGTGTDGGIPPGTHKALTPTLHRLFNGLAGRDEEDAPVVFGELWGMDAGKGGKREIDLQVITTALNLRRPYRLPNDPGVDPLREFFYDPAEWSRMFPAVVMQWLYDKRRLKDGPRVTNASHAELLALPPPALWPVLVAVRLSLSFPGLLSAVPMYTLNGLRGVNRNEPVAPEDTGKVEFRVRKVYFSDGGLTSNCPVHLFDAALPEHPTFAVALNVYKTGEGGSRRVWLHDGSKENLPDVRPFGKKCAVGSALAFASAILDTALNWRDSLQRTLPGYRERVVGIGLKEEEGGLNLAMAPGTIRRVADLGASAAECLLQAFDGPRTDGRLNAWDIHRWTRLRSTLHAAQCHLAEVREAVGAKSGVPGEAGYRALLDARIERDPRLVDAAAVAQALALLDGITKLGAGDPDEPARDLGDNAPQPAPRLRMNSPW